MVAYAHHAAGMFRQSSSVRNCSPRRVWPGPDTHSAIGAVIRPGRKRSMDSAGIQCM